MRKYYKSAQQKIGLMIFIIGSVSVIFNIIDHSMIGDSIYVMLSDPSVWLVFILIIPFFISILIENNFFKILQIALLLFTGIMNILDSYNDVYGPGLFFVAWLLGRHYGFFDRYKKIKYTLLFLLLIVMTQVSAVIHNKGTFQAGTGILIYTAFIVIFVLIIWQDMLNNQKKLLSENKSLNINYSRIRDQLAQIETEHKPYNLKALKITPAEERVIKVLTVYKASNREIAERLNIAESTVKLHLYNIYNKFGVDNRFAIIDLCKYNYA